MCGRVLYLHQPHDLHELLGLTELPVFEPSYNLAPTEPILTVPALGRAEALRWGLELSHPRARGFNAKGENLGRLYAHATKVLIVVSGFYEWKTLGPKEKQPFLFQRTDGAPLVLAGIRDASGAAIVTAPASGLVAEVHDRMPVILEREAFERWLSSDVRAAGLIAGAVADALRRHPVANDVGDVRNNRPELTAPVAERLRPPARPTQLGLFAEGDQPIAARGSARSLFSR